MTTYTVEDIVDALDGRSKAAERFNIKYDAVLKWSINGIPTKHWPNIVKWTDYEYPDLEPLHPDNFKDKERCA